MKYRIPGGPTPPLDRPAWPGSVSLAGLIACALCLSQISTADADPGTGVVVVMARGAAPLSKDEVANVFIGRNKTLTPLDLPDSTATRAVFYKKATDRDLAQIRAVWARLTFTGSGLPPKQLADGSAVKKAVAADPKAVGYIDKADVDSSVSVVLELN
jgi:hypothetical protein